MTLKSFNESQLVIDPIELAKKENRHFIEHLINVMKHLTKKDLHLEAIMYHLSQKRENFIEQFV